MPGIKPSRLYARHMLSSLYCSGPKTLYIIPSKTLLGGKKKRKLSYQLQPKIRE